MKIPTLAPFALAIGCSVTAFAQDPATLPAACKNLALMQAQMLSTRFDDGQMSGKANNPSHLVLKTANNMHITKVQFLGSDGEKAEAGSAPNCETNPDVCTNPADAGGAIGWSRVTVEGPGIYPAAEIVVSFGSRGGCSIASAKTTAQ